MTQVDTNPGAHSRSLKFFDTPSPRLNLRQAFRYGFSPILHVRSQIVHVLGLTRHSIVYVCSSVIHVKPVIASIMHMQMLAVAKG